MPDPYYPTGKIVHASTQDIENSIRKDMEDIDPLAGIEKTTEQLEKFTATTLAFCYKHDRTGLIFIWGYVVLCDYGKVRTFRTMLNSGELNENMRQVYQDMLDELNTKILKLGKAEKTVSRKPWSELTPEKQKEYAKAWRIYVAMRKENKELSLDGWHINPKVTDKEWGERLTQYNVKIGKSPRTLNTVKYYGERGDIKSHKKQPL